MKKSITKIITILLIAVMTVCMNMYSYAKVKGDVNNDGGADNKDVVVLFKYVSSGTGAEDKSVYDFNGDGFVDNKDVVELFRELSGNTGLETSAEATDTEDTDYKIFVYDSSEGETGSSEGQTSGKAFYGITEESKKDGMEGKTIQMFGKVYTLSYTKTMDYKLYDEKYDRYYGDGGVFMFGEKTGRLAEYYAKSADIPAEGFVPPVNAHSSRQNFIDYAKTILLEYFNTPTDDCDVKIETIKLNTTYRYTEEEYRLDFKNFIDRDPDFSAEYHIKFFKRFKGIYRFDNIEVDITSDGKVLLVRSYTCDEKIEKFNDVSIDAECLREQIKKRSYDPSYLSYGMLLRAIPDDNELWVLADVEFDYEKYDEILVGGRQYITKIYGYPEDAGAEPYDTELVTDSE